MAVAIETRLHRRILLVLGHATKRNSLPPVYRPARRNVLKTGTSVAVATRTGCSPDRRTMMTNVSASGLFQSRGAEAERRQREEGRRAACNGPDNGPSRADRVRSPPTRSTL